MAFVPEYMSRWTKVTTGELYLFFAVIFLVAVHSKHDVRSCWSTKAILTIPIFSKIMARNRLILIFKMLHFSSNAEQQRGDRLHKIRNVLDRLKANFKKLYKPYQNVAIDESLVPF